MNTQTIAVTRNRNSLKAGAAAGMPRALKLLLGSLAFAALSGTAMARDHIAFSISIGTPMPVYAPPPVYVAAPPVHVSYNFAYAPPPRVVYYATPYPAPRWYGREYGGHHGHGYVYGRGGEHRHGWR